MRSVMKHQFSRVPSVAVPRSQFDRSHGVKTTFDAGYVIPIFVDEALPGDTLNCHLTGFARLSTPIFPIMDNMFMDTHFFSVPIRQIWENWTKFCGEQIDPGDSIDYTVPVMTAPGGAGYAEDSLHDYLGFPTKVSNGYTHSSLWHRAYNKIWNEWFRAQDIQDSLVVDIDDGPDTYTDYDVPARRNKRHDYFTSCLPWPQKGDAVEFSIGSSAPLSPAQPDVDPNGAPLFNVGGETLGLASVATQNAVDWDSTPTYTDGSVTWSAPRLQLESGVTVDLSSATAVTVNELRQAVQVQRILEKDARGGTRYPEILLNHFGVRDPQHAVLQRSEYLGGGTSYVNISPIAQTSESSTTPQGNLAAMGTAVLKGHGFVKSFTEHCVLIGVISVRADLTYQQGLQRMFSRSTRYDFYWPSLAHIGEQAVLTKELYLDGGTHDDDVFGYQERWAEYRYKPSMITGRFRSNCTTPLDTWHLSQEFSTTPTLNNTFIIEDPPLDRCVAVPSEPHFIFDGYFNYKCARPMPVYSVPGLTDHF